MNRVLLAFLAMVLLVSVAVAVTAVAATRMLGMGEGPLLPPPVRGYYRGQEVLFMHTEASDRQVAELLTGMTAMHSLVLYAPRLASVPDEALGKVYVFTNGLPGRGFQIDVFDSAPGDDGYSPLRMVQLVTWQEGSTPRELRSAEEVLRAETSGEVIVYRSGVVVNMPFLSWPGGHR